MICEQLLTRQGNAPEWGGGYPKESEMKGPARSIARNGHSFRPMFKFIYQVEEAPCAHRLGV